MGRWLSGWELRNYEMLHQSGSWNALQSNRNPFLPRLAYLFTMKGDAARYEYLNRCVNGIGGFTIDFTLVGSKSMRKENARDNSSTEWRENVQKNNSIWPIDSQHRKCSARWCLFIIYVLKFLLQFSIFLLLLHLRSQFNSRRDFFFRSAKTKQFFSRFAISIVVRLKCKHNWNGADLCIESECGEKFPPDSSADLRPFGIRWKVSQERRLNFTGKI